MHNERARRRELLNHGQNVSGFRSMSRHELPITTDPVSSLLFGSPLVAPCTPNPPNLRRAFLPLLGAPWTQARRLSRSKTRRTRLSDLVSTRVSDATRATLSREFKNDSRRWFLVRRGRPSQRCSRLRRPRSAISSDFPWRATYAWVNSIGETRGAEGAKRWSEITVRSSAIQGVGLNSGEGLRDARELE